MNITEKDFIIDSKSHWGLEGGYVYVKLKVNNKMYRIGYQRPVEFEIKEYIKGDFSDVPNYKWFVESLDVAKQYVYIEDGMDAFPNNDAIIKMLQIHLIGSL